MKATKIENTLHLLSIAMCVIINQEIYKTYSFFLGDYKNDKEMIIDFLKTIYKNCDKIQKSNKLLLTDLNKKVDSKLQFSEIPIIGFNSAKFDMNLIVKN
jgi:hypothetical protein